MRQNPFCHTVPIVLYYYCLLNNCASSGALITQRLDVIKTCCVRRQLSWTVFHKRARALGWRHHIILVQTHKQLNRNTTKTVSTQIVRIAHCNIETTQRGQRRRHIRVLGACERILKVSSCQIHRADVCLFKMHTAERESTTRAALLLLLKKCVVGSTQINKNHPGFRVECFFLSGFWARAQVMHVCLHMHRFPCYF